MPCPDCSSRNIILDWSLGECYCGSCGLIIEDRLVDYSDLSFTFTGDASSVHHSITSFMEKNHGLGTPLGKIFKMLTRGRIRNLSPEGIERSFSDALPTLKAAWNALRLPLYLKIGSAMLYRKSIRLRLTKGRKIEGMALASIYNACENAKMPRDITKVARYLEVSPLTVYAYSKTIRREIHRYRPSASVRDYINKGTMALELSKWISDRAFELGEEVIKGRAELGKHPAVVAGVVIYRACRENEFKMSQSKIAEALSVSERSIRRIVS